MLVVVYNFLDFQSKSFLNLNLQKTYYPFIENCTVDKMEKFWIRRNSVGQMDMKLQRRIEKTMVGRKGRKTCVKPVFVKRIVRSRQRSQGNALMMSGMEGLST